MKLSRLLYNLSSHIDYYSKFQPTSFTLKSLIDFGLYTKREIFIIDYYYYFNIFQLVMLTLNNRINFYVLNC